MEVSQLKASVIACKTLEDEINKCLCTTKIHYPLYWIESGLHNYPDQLKNKLQQCIDEITESDYIIMLFGLCGNALLDISSQTATLVIPKVDDCISLFLGGNEKRRKMGNIVNAYFLTKGWLRYENNIWIEYLRSVKKYGREKTRSLFKIMLKHYTHLIVIETGAFDTEEFVKETKIIAKELNLVHQVINGDLTLFYKALQTDWTTDFALIKPGQKVTLQSMDTCINNMGASLPNVQSAMKKSL